MVGLAAAVLGIGAGALVTAAVLRRQAAIARRRIGKPHGELAPDSDRVWRSKLEGKPLDLVVLGDSIAAGLGAARRKDTLGARLAKGLARVLRRPVRLHTIAIVGAETSLLARQLDALPPGLRPELAVVIVGGNDVTHRIPVSESTTQLRSAVERLRDLGAEVVVGTCPDLGALRPVPQPLRSIVSRWSRQLGEAQESVARAAGAHPVSLRRTVGPFFVADPDEMFSLDRFHPSALGYRRTADAMLPVALAALRDRETLQRLP
ncbi:MAG: GDSL family lipase [Leifsonia xyli]|nr:MAG: GDSL family lipase [Leifsonia xyli]